jgi:hypothetical protein
MGAYLLPMPAMKDRRELVLDRTAIDDLVKSRFGNTKQKTVAAMLEIPESVWSQYRNAKRGLPGTFVADLIHIFPGVPLQSYARSIPASELAKR